MATPTSNDEDLLSGPLSSFGSSAPSLEYSPDPKQGLATPPVELLLSDHFYLVGAARVVADDVTEVKAFRFNFWTVGDFAWALHKPYVDPAPLALSSQSPKEEDLFCTSLLVRSKS